MDIVSLLVSLNKISLIALVITVGFVFYQIYLLKKETENKKKKLTVPDFKAVGATTFSQATKVIVAEEKKIYAKSSRLPMVIGIILFVVFATIFIFGFFHSTGGGLIGLNPTPTPQVNLVASKGIKIYNQNWQPVNDDILKKMQPGQEVIVGIETVQAADIDMARIRVNKNTWDLKDITVNFNKQFNVFYKEHIISTGEASLKIEAELHSKTDGWLGD